MALASVQCRYHVQDDVNFCGAACAMMILAQQGIDPATLKQSDLQGKLIANAPAGIATLPNKLVDILNSYIPGKFSDVRATSPEDATRRIIQSLRGGVPAAVPIFGVIHWVVVKEVTTDADPTANDGSYRVLRVWLNNPITQRISGIPPHTSNDLCQFSGGVISEAYDGEWLVNLSQPTYDDFKFNCVVGAGPETGLPAGPSAPPPINPSFNEALAEQALMGILASEDSKDIRTNLAPSGVVNVTSLGLVRSLTDDVDDYYLISINDERGAIGSARMDAKRPQLLSVAVFGSPQEKIVPEQGAVREALMSAEIPDAPDSESWWESQVKLSQLVWRPCSESLSPHVPFLAVPLTSSLQPQRHVFVRFDKSKSVFPELTIPLKGG